MAIYELKTDRIQPVQPTTFALAGISERGDLQRLLRSQVDIISPGTLVIAEEFGEWEDSRRRIDLLGVDKDANLVVIELKRTEDGGHMELQAIRYAAMVSAMTFERAVEVYHDYLQRIGSSCEARSTLLEFLEWEDPDEDAFGPDVRMVLVAADFSKELTTAVMWLNDREIDIRCIRVKPYQDTGRVMLDVQQIIPLPEVEEYRVQIKAKQQRERLARKFNPDFTKYDVTVGGVQHQRLPKRGMVLEIVRYLCQLGHSPEPIANAVSSRRNSMFRAVPGVVRAAEFPARAEAVAVSEGRTFEARRFYCDDEDLIVADGQTYALTNQWGSRTTEAIDSLIQAFPDADISYVPAPEAENGRP